MDASVFVLSEPSIGTSYNIASQDGQGHSSTSTVAIRDHINLSPIFGDIVSTDSTSQEVPTPVTTPARTGDYNFFEVPNAHKLSGIAVSGSRNDIKLQISDIAGQSLADLGLVLEFATVEGDPDSSATSTSPHGD